MLLFLNRAFYGNSLLVVSTKSNVYTRKVGVGGGVTDIMAIIATNSSKAFIVNESVPVCSDLSFQIQCSRSDLASEYRNILDHRLSKNTTFDKKSILFLPSASLNSRVFSESVVPGWSVCILSTKEKLFKVSTLFGYIF